MSVKLNLFSTLHVSKEEEKLATNEIRHGGYMNAGGGVVRVFAPDEAYLVRKRVHGKACSLMYSRVTKVLTCHILSHYKD